MWGFSKRYHLSWGQVSFHLFIFMLSGIAFLSQKTSIFCRGICSTDILVFRNVNEVSKYGIFSIQVLRLGLLSFSISWMNRKLILCHSIAFDFYLEGSDKVHYRFSSAALHFDPWECDYTPATARRSSSKEGRSCPSARESVCENGKKDGRLTGSSPKQDLRRHNNTVLEKAEAHLLLITQHRHCLP